MWKPKPKITVINADFFDAETNLSVSYARRDVEEFSGCVRVYDEAKERPLEIWFKIIVHNGEIEKPGIFTCDGVVLTTEAWDCVYKIVRDGLKKAGHHIK